MNIGTSTLGTTPQMPVVVTPILFYRGLWQGMEMIAQSLQESQCEGSIDLTNLEINHW